MTLAAAAALVPRVAAVRWLGAVGAPLGAAERTAAAAYLAGLGYADTPVAGVADWTRAKALADAPDWDPGWWQAEEALRQALLAAGTARDGSGAVLAALTGVTQAVSDRAYEDATSATRRAGIADAALARAAAGAATQAAYLAALAAVADAPPSHPFFAKLRLFEAGRWPLGIVAGAFHLF
ncbi:MAG TPA: hypothetical protein VMB81_28510 [Candidatus Sulfotelmatobacter sp.]|nr:hypothetical protein [Candidatus Sulfotelmatobacter sp.]